MLLYNILGMDRFRFCRRCPTNGASRDQDGVTEHLAPGGGNLDQVAGNQVFGGDHLSGGGRHDVEQDPNMNPWYIAPTYLEDVSPSADDDVVMVLDGLVEVPLVLSKKMVSGKTFSRT